MQYRMKIKCEKDMKVYNCNLNKWIVISIGQRYKYEPKKPAIQKQRKNLGRIVEVLGFIDDFMPRDAIIRYLDNNRRGRVEINCLIPEEENIGVS